MTYVEILRGGSIKKDDTEPPLRVKCFTEGNDPFNLDGYSATLKMRRSDGDTNKVDSSATVEQAGVGVVEYTWQSGDTDTSGVFDAEIVADDGSGGTVTFPNQGFFTIKIEDGL